MKERSVTRLDSKLRRHSIPLADRNVFVREIDFCYWIKKKV